MQILMSVLKAPVSVIKYVPIPLDLTLAAAERDMPCIQITTHVKVHVLYNERLNVQQ